jgi:hypothetical protein
VLLFAADELSGWVRGIQRQHKDRYSDSKYFNVWKRVQPYLSPAVSAQLQAWANADHSAFTVYAQAASASGSEQKKSGALGAWPPAAAAWFQAKQAVLVCLAAADSVAAEV